jgi:hypothetical protein
MLRPLYWIAEGHTGFLAHSLGPPQRGPDGGRLYVDDTESVAQRFHDVRADDVLRRTPRVGKREVDLDRVLANVNPVDKTEVDDAESKFRIFDVFQDFENLFSRYHSAFFLHIS